MTDRPVYISSSVFRGRTIEQTVLECAERGITHVEWSGGHPRTVNDHDALRTANQRYGVVSRLHNYFPPPQEEFVLNLASPDAEVAKRSINHVRTALDLSGEIGATEYGVHAGFLLDPDPSRLGQRFDPTNLFDRHDAIARFTDRFHTLARYAESCGVTLFAENNVVSRENAATFGPHRPFMLLDYEDYRELYQRGVNRLLLDLAHLYVTARSYGWDYDTQATAMLHEARYIHISGNDGTRDTNDPVSVSAPILQPFINNTRPEVTVEVYTSVDEAIASATLIEQIHMRGRD